MTSETVLDRTETILLTALGKIAKESTYSLNDRTANAKLAPLALLQLLDASDRPNLVLTMVTQEAKKETWNDFEKEVDQILKVKPTEIPIPDGCNTNEIRTILETVAARFPERCRLILDVTQGFRHFPFIVYALALYLQSLKGITIIGAYYGMIEGSRDPKPLIDLRPLLDLPEWFYAIRVFRDTGATTPMARLFQPASTNLHNRARELNNNPDLHKQGSEIDTLIRCFKDLSFYYESALPLELGQSAQTIASKLERDLPPSIAKTLPLSNGLSEMIKDSFHESAFVQPIRFSGKWKESIELNPSELKRQADLIDIYLERQQYALAFGLMREWVVSWTVLQTPQKGIWLNLNISRHPAENQLGCIASLNRGSSKTLLNDSQREWGEFWNNLIEMRNSLHHHGMLEDVVDLSSRLNHVLNFWQQLKTGTKSFPSLGGGKGKLLISAQGTKPGVLYSALMAAKPDWCLALCSKISQSTIQEAASRAGFTGEIETLILNDPFGGFTEIDRLENEAVKILFQADEIVANLTGGTTLMGIVVQRLVERGKMLNRPYRRFALIDRRKPEDQDTDPYVPSEFHWLDRESDGDAEHEA